MEEYRYIVCDYSMEDAIPSQEFEFLQDALSYAKTGSQTLIWKRKLVNGEWKDEEDEIVWSIEDEKDWPDPEPLPAFPLDEELSWPHPDQAESMPLNEELQVFSKDGKAVAA